MMRGVSSKFFNFNSLRAKLSNRSLATLNIDSFGSPLSVLRYDATAFSATAPGANEVTVTLKYANFTVEDLRTIQGESLVNRSSGVGGSFGVGTVAKVGDSSDLKVNSKVIVLGGGVWSDKVTASSNHVIPVDNLSHEDSISIPSFVSAWAILDGVDPKMTIVQATGESSIGRAIVQLGKVKGLNIISATDSEISDAGFIEKYKGKVNYAITGRSGKVDSILMKVLADNGKMMVYNGIYQSLSATASIDVPVSACVFRNVGLTGFDFDSWARENPERFRNAVNDVTQLLSTKKISLNATIYPLAEYKKAISHIVEKDGALCALQL